MTVSAVNGDDVHSGIPESGGSFQQIPAGAHRCPHSQTAELILAGVGVFDDLHDVLDRDEPPQLALLIHHQEFFNPVLVEQSLGFFEGDPERSCNQVLLCHDFGYPEVHIGFEAQVAVGDDADQLPALHHRHPRDAIFGHQFEDIGDVLVGSHRHRIGDHPALRLLDLGYFTGLPFDGHITVNETNPSLSGQADSRCGLGDRVHGGTGQRDAQGDLTGEHGFDRSFVRQNL